MADFWATGKTTKSAKTLGNPSEHAGIGKKNPTGDPVGFLIWWWGRTPFQTQRTGLVFAANGCIEQLRKPPTWLAVYQRLMVDLIENCGRQFKSAFRT